jgi:hypothetical protein
VLFSLNVIYYVVASSKKSTYYESWLKMNKIKSKILSYKYPIVILYYKLLR